MRRSRSQSSTPMRRSRETRLTAAIPMANPYCSCVLTRDPRLTAAIPMENLCCSCKLTLVMAYSCNPYGEPLLQL